MGVVIRMHHGGARTADRQRTDILADRAADAGEGMPEESMMETAPFPSGGIRTEPRLAIEPGRGEGAGDERRARRFVEVRVTMVERVEQCLCITGPEQVCIGRLRAPGAVTRAGRR